jgi:hypothetical protein
MEDNNEAVLREIVQRGIGSRELKYGIMRVMRIFFGWPAWTLGMGGITAGALMAGLALVEPEHVVLADVLRSGAWALLGLAGAGLMVAGLSMAVPYQFETFMPGSESERVCLHCGHPLPPAQIFSRCEGCGSWFPLDAKTYIGRSISRLATVINVLIMLVIGVFLVAK